MTHMHSQFANGFYRSAAWKKTREAYAASKGGLCERCLAMGLISPGEEVHHRIRLTPDNLSDPEIALSWTNLELLCRECHKKEHQGHERRYTTDEDGHVLL